MGYNTSVIVLNDALGAISEDKEFGKRLADAIAQMTMSRDKRIDVAAHTPGGGIHCNAASVIESHHADGTAVIAVGGNYGTKLGEAYYTRAHHTDEGKIEVLRRVAEQLGYRLQKIPKKGDK